MSQNILTIIIKIKDGCADKLEKYLRDEINPEEVTRDRKLQCKDALPFDKLSSLHFASMAVLRDDTGDKGEQIDPCFMFEATFDGTAADFLDDLIELSGDGLHTILKDCEGYPVSGTNLKPILRRYLLEHDVGYDIFYAGQPGKSVGQILGEDTLRRRVVKFARMAARWPDRLAFGFREIQRMIRRDIVRAGPRPNAPDLRWAEEKPTVPFLVRYGRHLVKCVGAFGLFILAWIIFKATGSDRVTWIPDTNASDAIKNMLAILVIWFVFRVAVFGFSLWERPMMHGISWVLWTNGRIAASFVRWVSFFVFVAAAIIALRPVSARYIEPWGVFWILAGLFVAALGLGAIWLSRRYVKSLPDDPHEDVYKIKLRELSVDVLQVLMLIIFWLVLVLIVRWLPENSLKEVSDFTVWFVSIGVIAVSILATIGVAFFALLLIIYVGEIFYDSRHYADANVLTKPPTSSKKFQREGYGPNKVQNHLISLSWIKNTWWHRTRLRVVLFTINLICRFWYNRGDLGGIHDIHFLRWIIIDQGRRLLFLDNYHGSWDAYLNAFIDGGAVKGMNAIWSHTYVRRNEKDKDWDKNRDIRVGYPKTACMMWQGARDERAFKEVVRTSQVETLVWYSAYPFLSGINILTNRSIRDSLFSDLDTKSLDELAQRIR